MFGRSRSISAARALVEDALAVARTDVSDSDARSDLLRLAPNPDEEVIRTARRMLGQGEMPYDLDRADRLLRSLETNTEVPPPDPGRRALFARERDLATRPLTDAFALLCEIEPRLREFCPDGGLEATEPVARPSPPQMRAMSKAYKRLSRLVGPRASAADPLLRSPTALYVAGRFLQERFYASPETNGSEDT
jgi:hypothetical protein